MYRIPAPLAPLVYHHRVILTLTLAASFAVAAQASPPKTVAPPPDAESLLSRFDARSRTIHDFTAKFTQTYRSGALGRALVESGTLKVKRPSRMLFEYLNPDKKLFVADSDRYYFYVPRDKQVMVQDQRGDRRATARVLAEGRILEHFKCVGEETDPLGRKLILAPLDKDPSVARVSIVLDSELRLVALEIKDAEGSTSRLVFEGFKENVGLKDSEFHFEVPKGVEVIS
jgi:outer membrane lipoprotein carrier protein